MPPAWRVCEHCGHDLCEWCCDKMRAAKRTMQALGALKPDPVPPVEGGTTSGEGAQ